MGVAIVTGDLLALRCWATNGPQAAVNTFNYVCASVSGGGITDQDFANYMESNVLNFYGPLMTTHSQFNGVQVYFIRRTPPILPAPVKSVLGAGNGTQTGSPLPTGSCAIMKYSTSVRGPKGRGRVFLPFTAASYMGIDGLPDTALQVLVNSFAAFLLTPQVITVGGNTATMLWTLVKKKKGTIPTDTLIVNAEAANKFAGLHKRSAYGQPNISPI